MPVGAPATQMPPPSMGQPPVGSSPATGPVPNKGLEAAGLAKLGLIVRLLESLIPALGSGTEAGKDVLKALTSLSKHVPPGAVSPGIENSALMNLSQQQRQQQPQIAAMRAAMAQQNPGAGAPPASPPAEAE